MGEGSGQRVQAKGSMTWASLCGRHRSKSRPIPIRIGRFVSESAMANAESCICNRSQRSQTGITTKKFGFGSYQPISADMRGADEINGGREVEGGVLGVGCTRPRAIMVGGCKSRRGIRLELENRLGS